MKIKNRKLARRIQENEEAIYRLAVRLTHDIQGQPFTSKDYATQTLPLRAQIEQDENTLRDHGFDRYGELCQKNAPTKTIEGMETARSVTCTPKQALKDRRTMKNGKRILSVKVKRMLDDLPDTSHLGEYSMTRKSEFSIDRAHTEDCASVSESARLAAEKLVRIFNYIAKLEPDSESEKESLYESCNVVDELQTYAQECDCGEHGDMGRNEYRYFNPSFNYVDKAGKPTDGLTAEEVRKYVRQDYERMESLAAGNWCYIGIQAQAQIGLGDVSQYPKKYNVTLQTIASGSLWGIESDSDAAYLESEEKEQLADLRNQLLMLGFSRRAISTAFKNVEHETE